MCNETKKILQWILCSSQPYLSICPVCKFPKETDNVKKEPVDTLAAAHPNPVWWFLCEEDTLSGYGRLPLGASRLRLQLRSACGEQRAHSSHALFRVQKAPSLASAAAFTTRACARCCSERSGCRYAWIGKNHSHQSRRKVGDT